MIRGGTGGGNTVTGLQFEGRASLANALARTGLFSVKDMKIMKNGDHVATLCPKHAFYHTLLMPRKLRWQTIISQQLLPDEALHVISNNKVYIVEIKFQQVAGSVDEKLQTCGYKKQQYSKLLTPAGIEVEYVYVLNDWFKQDRYRDVLDYIHSAGCHFYFNTVPLEFFGLI
jgi:hypothetical protein